MTLSFTAASLSGFGARSLSIDKGMEIFNGRLMFFVSSAPGCHPALRQPS
jgi:hypothetical protein